MTNIFLTFAIGLLSAGCCSPLAELTKEQASLDYYGRYPTNCEVIVAQYYRDLTFPLGAMRRIIATAPPVPGYSRHAPIFGGGVHRFGYIVLTQLEVKPILMRPSIHYYNVLIRNEVVVDDWELRGGWSSYFSEPWYDRGWMERCANQVSEATSNPAPNAGSSAPQD